MRGRLSVRLSRIGVALVVAGGLAGCGNSPAAPARTVMATAIAAGSSAPFKVATWNIRSGMGIRGFATTHWSSDTLNCTDRSKPLNAWGIGLPQAELSRIREDAAIVAVSLQEAWNCGNPSNVNGVLGFASISEERNGTALAARYGFASGPTYTRVSGNDWIVGATVCLDPACTSSVPMFAAHWTVATAEFPTVAARTLEVLAAQSSPHVLFGDLNVYRVDTWNPDVPCTGADVAGRVQAIERLDAAGYVDAWKATQGGEGWTGMATRNGCGVPNGNLFKRIDYVYAKGLRPLSTTRIGRAAPGEDSPSDHVAVIAELALPR